MIFGVPWVLASQLFAEMIFVGLVSYEVNSDADREWLGRGAGWIAATAVIWALTAFISFAGGHFLIDVKSWVAPYIASAGGIAGIAAALIGKSTQTSPKPNEQDHSFKAIASKIGLAIAGPIFAAVLVVGISVALDLLLLGDSLVQGLTKHKLTTGYIALWLIIGMVATRICRRGRLPQREHQPLLAARALPQPAGARLSRRLAPAPLPGPVHRLRRRGQSAGPQAVAAEAAPQRGKHVLPVPCGQHHAQCRAKQRGSPGSSARPSRSRSARCIAAPPTKGFRPSLEYGGGAPFGLSLGTAMAISGAAASPNMGYHSSPSITLLLALFNVRLGWWLGNPGKEGEKTYKDEGPATAIVPLAEETFGLTTDDKPYVYLSDGGHFENLGLYEMVRRRCRFIVAIDAGCDPDFAFEDLGNAVRKIFIDLGIRIQIQWARQAQEPSRRQSN